MEIKAVIREIQLSTNFLLIYKFNSLITMENQNSISQIKKTGYTNLIFNENYNILEIRIYEPRQADLDFAENYNNRELVFYDLRSNFIRGQFILTYKTDEFKNELTIFLFQTSEELPELTTYPNDYLFPDQLFGCGRPVIEIGTDSYSIRAKVEKNTEIEYKDYLSKKYCMRKEIRKNIDFTLSLAEMPGFLSWNTEYCYFYPFESNTENRYPCRIQLTNKHYDKSLDQLEIKVNLFVCNESEMSAGKWLEATPPSQEIWTVEISE